jgi:CRISPR system Cascade subunit CasA
VPYGKPAQLDELPWMRPTRVSKAKDAITCPTGDGMFVETFFGMPRRLRLIFSDRKVSAVVQRPYGTNYALWQHPLTPYYQLKPGTEKLPVHPKAGFFGYRNWLGILYDDDGKSPQRFRAQTVQTYSERPDDSIGREARMLVAGWAMDNMKPRDFIWSEQPLVHLTPPQTAMLRHMIQAAELFAGELRTRLKPVLGEESALDAAVEAFYQQSDASFQSRVAQLRQGVAVAAAWVADLRRVALNLYDAVALTGFDQRDAEAIKAITTGRGWLLGAFSGHGKTGAAAFGLLELPLPERKEKP